MLFLSQQSETISLRAVNDIVDKYAQASGLKRMEDRRTDYESLLRQRSTNTRDITWWQNSLVTNGLGQIKRYVGVGNDVRRTALCNGGV